MGDTSTICMEDLVVIMSSLWYKHSSTLASLSSQSQINSHALYYKTKTKQKQNKNKTKKTINMSMNGYQVSRNGKVVTHRTIIGAQVEIYNMWLEAFQEDITETLDLCNKGLEETEPSMPHADERKLLTLMKKTYIYAYNLNMEKYEKYKQKTIEESMVVMEAKEERVAEGLLKEGCYLSYCKFAMGSRKQILALGGDAQMIIKIKASFDPTSMVAFSTMLKSEGLIQNDLF